MGLLARTGEGFQPWVWAKLAIWFFVTGISHMVAKRFPRFAWHAYGFMILSAALAAWLAINKPY
jgi:hypothetical protein